MCVGIVRNNSLAGGRSRTEARTPATERVTLYCTLNLLNLFVTQNTSTSIIEKSNTKSNVPTGHKGSKELH